MTRKSSLCVLATILASSPAGPALGGCKDIYPDAQVAAKLVKPEYAACNLDVMKADYAEILHEQARLLALLRPAYQRQLQKEKNFSELQQQVRLDEYDAKLQILSEVAVALPTVMAGPGNAGGGAGAQGDGPSVRELLMQGKEQSQALKSKIALAKDGLEDKEFVEDCKLDFYFRLRDVLHAKMRACFQGGG